MPESDVLAAIDGLRSHVTKQVDGVKTEVNGMKVEMATVVSNQSHMRDTIGTQTDNMTGYVADQAAIQEKISKLQVDMGKVQTTQKIYKWIVGLGGVAGGGGAGWKFWG